MESSAGQIRKSAIGCQLRFKDCMSNPSLDAQAWFVSSQADFNLWCFGLKATSTGISSLDYRLRDRQNISLMICNLLGGLEDALEKCLMTARADASTESTLGADNPVSDSESSWDGSCDNLCHDCLSPRDGFTELSRNIRTILNLLARIALTIQRSGVKHRFKKADDLLDEKLSSYTDLKNHLSWLILFKDPKCQSWEYDELYGELNEVQRRLVDANIVRRNRIEQSKKLVSPVPVSRTKERQNSNPEANESLRAAPLPAQNEGGAIPLEQSLASTSRLEEKPARSVVTDHVKPASTLGSGLTAKIQEAVAKKPRSVATRATRIGASVEYPRCPHGELDKAFTCPYCGSSLPLEYRERDRWQRHVAEDIMPYMCIFPDCETPTEMYISDEELMTHVTKEHSQRYWVCQFDPHVGTEEEPEIFESSDAWHSHMKDRHIDIIPVEQIPSFRILSERRMVPPIECPLCTFRLEKPALKVDDHILRHIHEFSLWSLPPDATAGEEDECKSSSNPSAQVKVIAQADVTEADDADEGWQVEGLDKLQEGQSDSATKILGDIVSSQRFLMSISNSETHVTALFRLIDLCLAKDASDRAAESQQEIYTTAIRKARDFMNHLVVDMELSLTTSREHLKADMINEIASNLTDEIRAARVASLPFPRLISIPAPRNPAFTGHQKILQALDRMLPTHEYVNGSKVVLLQGEEGVGKTEIALEFAHKTAENPFYGPVVWMRADGDPELAGLGDSVDDIIARLSSSSHGRWLLVLDGLTKEIAQELGAGIAMMKAVESTGCVLITTRDVGVSTFAENQEDRVKKNSTELIHIPAMDVDTAIALAEKLLANGGHATEPENVRQLARDCDYEPTAIKEAISEIGLRGLSVAGFTEMRSFMDPASTVESTWRRADRMFDPAEHQEFRRHLECIVLLRPSEDGRPRDDLDVSKLNQVQIRLINENLRRRHRFLWAQRHSSRGLGLLQYAPARGLGLLQYAPARGRTPGTAKTTITLIANAVEFPYPPPLSSGRPIVKCPCCCQTLPVEEFASRNKWRQHLVDDLCPYTCIAENCPVPHLIFRNRREWEMHIKRDHPPQWQCLLCDEQDLIFPKKEGIVDHILANHKEELLKTPLSTVISRSVVQRLGVRSCPLCPSHGPQDSPELVDHVLFHAYDFSLRALPWHQTISHDLDKPIGTYNLPEEKVDAERLEQWIMEAPPDTPKQLELSAYDRVDHSVLGSANLTEDIDYFAENAYFDQSVDGSSKARSTQTGSSLSLSQLPEDGSSLDLPPPIR